MHAPAASARLIYLDWLRVAAFGLLILYHVGMFYVTWDWIVKSEHAGHAIEPLLLVTNPSRLTLLFLVSGAATRFMADKLILRELATGRLVRLLMPLIFAIAVIVPPQSYYEAVEKFAYADSYAAFWGRYLAADDSFCGDGACLDLPSWGHLWFVAYLLAYTLLLTGLLAVARRPLRRVEALLAGLPGWALLLAPIAYLAAARLLLAPAFEVTHAFVDDWYNHAVSFPAFLFGFLLMTKDRVSQQCARLRWIALLLFVAAYAGWASYAWTYREAGAVPPEALRIAMRIVFTIDQWTAIIAVVGFASLHLTRDSRFLRTATVAVFPFYIAHQTLIVVAGHHLKALHLPALAEASALIAATLIGCWLTFELARRVRVLGPLLGLGPVRARPPLTPAAAQR